jgi:hypothetical protein
VRKEQLAWENRATVRTKPKLIFDPSQKGYFFPRSHQPLSVHPFVEELGEDAIAYLLTQSFYKYVNDIAIIETRVVNQTILNVIHNTLDIEFTYEQKINLHTVMIDEAYHAYVVYDAMQQIQHQTGVKSLSLPSTIEIEYAINTIKHKLEPSYHSMFELIAVCLAENTLTKEIITMVDAEETHPFFQELISDHLADESRHAGIFFHVLHFIWARLSDAYRYNIGGVLPEFLNLYLSNKVQIAFDRNVLLHLGITSIKVDEAITDVYGDFQLTAHHPKLKNILTILQKAGVDIREKEMEYF